MAHALNHHRHDWRMEEMDIAKPFLVIASFTLFAALLMMILV